MKKYEVKILPKANNHLKTLYTETMENISKIKADEIYKKLTEEVLNLNTYPERGVLVNSKYNIRKKFIDKYVIIYIVTQSVVYVYGITTNKTNYQYIIDQVIRKLEKNL